MANNPMRALLTLSITVGALVAATPAKATIYRNYVDENLCMGASGGTMTPGTHLIIWHCDQYKDQDWSMVSFSGSYGYPGYFQIYDNGAPAPPADASRCIATGPNGSDADGAVAVIWNCSANTDDQGWYPVYTGQDMSGRNCYYFQQMKAWEYLGKIRVLGVSGGNVVNGQPIILWDYGKWNLDQRWCEDDNY
jgi:hypothetical protein